MIKKLQLISSMLVLPVLMLSCAGGLNVASYRGNPTKQRVERDIGGGKKEGLYTNDGRFKGMQCFFDHDVKKFQELYNRAIKAGVKVDDL
jgi:hypothetical protein